MVAINCTTAVKAMGEWGRGGIIIVLAENIAEITQFLRKEKVKEIFKYIYIYMFKSSKIICNISLVELIDSSVFSAESSHFVSTEVNFLKTCHYVRTWITYLDSKFTLKVKKEISFEL